MSFLSPDRSCESGIRDRTRHERPKRRKEVAPAAWRMILMPRSAGGADKQTQAPTQILLYSVSFSVSVSSTTVDTPPSAALTLARIRRVPQAPPPFAN
ncbi:hypothetical protein BDZ89DRAFT_563926 [Hymenopellis radicata]|nr:hypothetical protein BDZ89DRAFT_563926 [Hymenopellis radicata]